MVNSNLKNIRRLIYPSYAKINLFLEILGHLPDNFHQIETLLCSVSLFDTIKYTLTKKKDLKKWIYLNDNISENNLIYKVADYLYNQYKPDWGIEIQLIKRIPIAAGLGGGSSNAATTLLALNSLWELGLSIDELNTIAASFGSDIPYFLYGGTALATNRGEIIQPIEDFNLDNILLVNPNIMISSSEAYQIASIPTENERRHCRISQDVKWFFNRLEAQVRIDYPLVNEILNDLIKLGASTALMSGSGPTCFGVFEDKFKMHKCEAYFKEKGYWTKLVRTITREEYQNVFQA
ncbi:MAG TPA: 4-(cytidine 5'-diphospho)-2-C-methyl-D-erythritol kinase [Candidatus Syntrophosphaera thermopropionivorans]|nr:4-(cytidine 5'-diphospho)-2-C-methyl-D-erythritol kinase [Candidatus Syntrophosphaera thermopropionivorans]